MEWSLVNTIPGKNVLSLDMNNSGINFAAYPDELVNKNKVAIRFECKEVGVI